jgi:hypothetical protein
MAKSGGGKGGKASHTNAERQHEVALTKLKYKQTLAFADHIFRVVRQLIYGAIICTCTYFVYRSVDSLAGKSTDVNATVRGVVKMGIDRWIYLSIASICGIGWRTERKLRRRTIEERGAYIKKLEAQLLPERKSSGLLPDGTQRQEDKDDA